MKIFKVYVMLLAFLITGIGAFAQHSYVTQANETMLAGYNKKIEGTEFHYPPVALADAGSMIVRATKGLLEMEWETESVPKNVSSKYVTFVLAVNVDTYNSGTPLVLHIDGGKQIPFFLNGKTSWSQSTPDGMTLYFESTEKLMYEMQGFILLRMPVSSIIKGKPLRLKITASDKGDNSWLMVHKKSVKPGLTVQPYPAIVEENSVNYRKQLATLVYFGNPVKASVKSNGKEVCSFDTKFGYTQATFNLPEEKGKRKNTFSCTVNGIDFKHTETVLPVKKWRVNFVQHTHTDIGYTRPQTEILAEHPRYIDYILDYCDVTDHYPDAAKFRWTCEASWAVDEFIKTRPDERIEKLKQRVQEGRIEITGMYYNFNEIPDEQVLARSLSAIQNIKKHGLPVKGAMQNDVNGIGWCFNDYFSSMGIKYLSMGTHEHRALSSFDKPTVFWWESPSGNKMLSFRADHYNMGNFFGLETGNFEMFENRLLKALTELEKKNYPFDIIAYQFSGFFTDNSAPSIIACDMVQKWNEKYKYPQLRIATMSNFFEEVEKKNTAELPVYKAAWPDWWTDGAGTGAREMAATRTAMANMISGHGALSMAKLLGAKAKDPIFSNMKEANSAVLFYNEHTYGASESVTDPFGKGTMEQRELKESYAWEGFRRSTVLHSEALNLLQDYIDKDVVPTVLAVNSLNWDRDAYARLFIDNQQIPRGKGIRLYDKEGTSYQAQEVQRKNGGSYWVLLLNKMPAFGYKKFYIDVIDKMPQETETNSSEFENQWYKIKIDKNKGTLTELFDKELKKEFIDKSASYGFGQLIHESLRTRMDLEQYYLKDYKRTVLNSVVYKGYTKGEIWNTIRFEGMPSETTYPNQGFTFEIRMYNHSKRIDFTYTLNKKPITDAESIYASFPFNLQDGRMYADVPGGVIEAGVDQLPGSVTDWNTIQNYVSVKNNDCQILFGSPETPLMQLGNINTGRFQQDARPESMHIYGWPMNNYWTTNFNADQHGDFEWSYYFTSTANTGNDAATRFGWGNRVTIPTLVLPASVTGNKQGKADKASLLSGIPDNVLLVNALPVEKENAMILHLRETKGSPIDFILQSKNKTVKYIESDVNGESMSGVLSQIALAPYQTKFIKLTW